MNTYFKSAGLSIAAGLTCLLGVPAHAQITASFTNTRPGFVTVFGANGQSSVMDINILDVERASLTGVNNMRKLSAVITVAPDYVFDGFNIFSLPSNAAGDPITSSEYQIDPLFNKATEDSRNRDRSTSFTYDNGVLEFNLSSSLATGLYYQYALAGGGFGTSFIRLQARDVSGGVNNGSISTVTLRYGVNVVEFGGLAAAPEPGTLALGLGVLPFVGGMLCKRRKK